MTWQSGSSRKGAIRLPSAPSSTARPLRPERSPRAARA
jgi:hypothetical protein